MKGYVCITGVSSGIGLAAAKILVENGYFVIGSVRSDKDGQNVSEMIGDNFKYLLLDLTNRISISDFSEKVRALVGAHGLKALVNNSGIAVGGPLMYIDEEDLKNQFDVNVLGLVIITKCLFPLLRLCSESRIINIGSVSSIIAQPFLGPYCASKFALEALSDSMRKELMPFNIKVIVIQAGPIQTPIWQKSLIQSEKYTDSPYAEQMAKVNRYIEKTATNAMSTERISQMIMSVIEKRSVRNRYLLHKGKFSLWLYRYILPDSWIDKLTFKLLFKQQRLE